MRDSSVNPFVASLSAAESKTKRLERIARPLRSLGHAKKAESRKTKGQSKKTKA